MKSLALALTAALSLWLPQAATAQTNSALGDLAYYGFLELAGLPQPQLLYADSVIVRRTGTIGSPAYLRVPPGHAKNWSKHCSRYNACSRPVYFVDDSWYQRTYVPAYQERHRDHDGHGKGKKEKHKNKGKGHDKD